MNSHLSLLHVRIHTLLDLQLDGLDLRGLGELRADDAVPESGDGVSCLSHLLHFVPGILSSEILFSREHARLLKGAGSFHIHRKTMKELGALAVLGVREQPNFAQNLVTHRH